MSIDATRWAYQQITGSSARKAVLVSMADRCGEDHTCYPSIARLSKDTELNGKTVRKAIQELCEIGLIQWTGETRGLGARVYKLLGVTDRHQAINPTNSGSTNFTTPTNFGSTNLGSTPLPNLGVKPINEPIIEHINEQIIDSAPEKNEIQDLEKKQDLDKKSKPDNQVKPPVKIQDLINLGVDAQTAHDFLRKKKNHEITHTALVRNQNQAEKAGLTLAQALKFATEAEWQAFTADYYFKRIQQQNNQNTGHIHANHQPTNNSANQQPLSHFDKLRAEADAKYGGHAIRTV